MKKIIIIIFLFIFTSNYAQSSESCKGYKKLSKDYLKCLGGKLIGAGGGDVGGDAGGV